MANMCLNTMRITGTPLDLERLKLDLKSSETAANKLGFILPCMSGEDYIFDLSIIEDDLNQNEDLYHQIYLWFETKWTQLEESDVLAISKQYNVGIYYEFEETSNPLFGRQIINNGTNLTYELKNEDFEKIIENNDGSYSVGELELQDMSWSEACELLLQENYPELKN